MGLPGAFVTIILLIKCSLFMMPVRWFKICAYIVYRLKNATTCYPATFRYVKSHRRSFECSKSGIKAETKGQISCYFSGDLNRKLLPLITNPSCTEH